MKSDKTVSLLGVRVQPTTYGAVMNTIERWRKKNQKTYICVAATHLIMECQKDPVLCTGVNSAGLTVTDGMPLVFIARWYGHARAERVYGPELMHRVCKMAARKKLRVALVGGARGQSTRLRRIMGEKYPGLLLVAAYTTPVRPVSTSGLAVMIRGINDARADIVLVGMGCPHQEQWMIQNRPRLRATVLIGVGAAFDFLTSDQKQAPQWMRSAGLEWAFRFFHEPKRLWRRYTVLTMQFVWKITRQLIRDFLLQ